MPLFTGGNTSEDIGDGDGREGDREAQGRGRRVLENTAEQMLGPPGSVAARFFVGGQDIDISSLHSLLFGSRDSPSSAGGSLGPRGMGSSSLAARQGQGQGRERARGGRDGRDGREGREGREGGVSAPGSSGGVGGSARGADAGNEVGGANVVGGTVLGQLLSLPWSSNTQPRTAGRRRPRESSERDVRAGRQGSGGVTGATGASFGIDIGLPSVNVFGSPGDAPSGGDGERIIEFPLPEGMSVPTSFALPILGSREMTDLFNEIFDASRQETRRSRVRRDDADAGTGGTGGDANRPSERSARHRSARSTGNARPSDTIRELELESQRLRGAMPMDTPRSRAYGNVSDATAPGSHPYTGKLLRSPPNWFLKPGQTWNGWQHVQHWPPGTSERWSVRVVLDFVNFEKGEVFGTMTASNVPGAENNVVTYFEGEIIDNENSTFYSNPDASARMCLAELRHWSRFPSFRPLRDSVLEEDGRAPALAESGKVFMRWKEKCFLSGGTDCRLTIAGLYYVTLDRVNGDIHAYYWDPNSAPEQKMNLKVGSSHQQGYALPVHKVA